MAKSTKTDLFIDKSVVRHIKGLPKWLQARVEEEAIKIAESRGVSSVQGNHVSVALSNLADEILTYK